MKNLFGLNGLGGYILSVLVLLIIVFWLGYSAIITQKNQANNFYTIENINTLQKNSVDNIKHYKVKE